MTPMYVAEYTDHEKSWVSDEEYLVSPHICKNDWQLLELVYATQSLLTSQSHTDRSKDMCRQY